MPVSALVIWAMMRAPVPSDRRIQYRLKDFPPLQSQRHGSSPLQCLWLHSQWGKGQCCSHIQLLILAQIMEMPISELKMKMIIAHYCHPPQICRIATRPTALRTHFCLLLPPFLPHYHSHFQITCLPHWALPRTPVLNPITLHLASVLMPKVSRTDLQLLNGIRPCLRPHPQFYSSRPCPRPLPRHISHHRKSSSMSTETRKPPLMESNTTTWKSTCGSLHRFPTMDTVK